MKNLKIEAEKGFRRTMFEPELVDPNMEINFVKNSVGLSSPRYRWVTIRRKGKSLNHTLHVDKESGATHDAGLTMFPSKRRVILSPSMVQLNFSPLKRTIRWRGLKPWMKGHVFALNLNGYARGMFQEKSQLETLQSSGRQRKVTVENSYSYISYS